jgi:hypothetical protein
MTEALPTVMEDEDDLNSTAASFTSGGVSSLSAKMFWFASALFIIAIARLQY